MPATTAGTSPTVVPRADERQRLRPSLTSFEGAATARSLGELAATILPFLALGFGAVASVQLPVIAMAAVAGVWPFSLQHRFERVGWKRGDAWEATDAALRGSSHLALRPALDWLTGHIGFHHVHHLNARIPNYRLPQAHRALNGSVVLPAPLGLRRALGASRFVPWDEANDRMIRFPRRVLA